jgi:hypothetical protein
MQARCVLSAGMSAFFCSFRLPEQKSKLDHMHSIGVAISK